MEIVTRGRLERVLLDGQAEIMVLGIDGRIVRLGVCEPVTPSRPQLSRTERWRSRRERGDYFFYPQGGQRMLVMSRMKGGRIPLDKLEIVVLDIEGQTVRLGLYENAESDRFRPTDKKSVGIGE